ncbi:hypothetical protein [Marinobacter alexandrii]|uniref:hypothetical protein n=1 Tax=Marinobacter alexandrii TaxID=2570351 RepID=UPI00329874C7
MLRWIGGPLGICLRRSWYRKRFKSCGERLVIDLGVMIEGAEHISAGHDVWIDKLAILIAGPNGPCNETQPVEIPHGEIQIGDASHICPNVIIQGHGGVRIGAYCTIGAGSALYSQSNIVSEVRRGTIVHADYIPPKIDNPISLGRNVWCGLGVKVFKGAIGDDAFIKPGTIVNADIPSNRMIWNLRDSSKAPSRFAPESEQ